MDDQGTSVNRRRRWIQIVLPILILFLGVGGAVGLVATRPVLESADAPQVLSVVRVLTPEARSLGLKVRSQGIVQPHTESLLSSQVSGQVVSIAPELEVGGFVQRHQVLVQVDRRNYQVAVEEAEARVASARLALAQEGAEAELAQREWDALPDRDAAAGELALRRPQLMRAKAQLEAAVAALDRARLDLARTSIRAPYDGRVSEKLVDLGELVTGGLPVARIHATDRAEVLLTVTADQLGHLGMVPGAPVASGQGPGVELHAEVGGLRHRWGGRVVRTAGLLDRQTQQHRLVVEIEDPYAQAGGQTSPLPIGMFVEATLEGRRIDGAVSVPRHALRGDSELILVDAEGRLRLRAVDVIKFQDEQAVLKPGQILSGERVCVSPMTVVVDGMRVQAVDEGAAVASTTAVSGAGAAVVDGRPQPRDSAAGGAEGVRPDPGAVAFASPAADGGSTASVPCRPRATLGAVEVVESGPAGATVRIPLSGELDYTTFRLSSPERLVIDFAGAVLPRSAASMETAAPGLARLRFGQHSSCPSPVARVVFDLDGPSDRPLGVEASIASDGAALEVALVADAAAPSQLSAL
ncbi:MAG: efflux RND transporter periplasmic adaptor subunit [Acidobacteriota bacterium]